jgi:dTDP-4-dehydrorhamnose 3,5-epimerase
MSMKPVQDRSTVDPSGKPKQQLIEGVLIRRPVVHADARGTLCEIYRPEWGVHVAPLVDVYQFTIRPGMIKGWHKHHLHDDRIFLSQGTIKVVLYDDRPESPTHGMVNEIYRTAESRDLMVIPAYVFHAHQNVGSVDALCVSMPTRPYNHEDPDVYRLPIDNDYIPYEFDDRKGW